MCVSSSGRHFSSHCSWLGETVLQAFISQVLLVPKLRQQMSSLHEGPQISHNDPKSLKKLYPSGQNMRKTPPRRRQTFWSLKTKRVLSLAEVRKRGRFQRICSRATEGGTGADCHEQPCSPLVTCCQVLSSGVFSCFFCVWVILLHFAQFVQTPTQVCCVFSDSSLCPDPGHFHISLER